jgi:integrase
MASIHRDPRFPNGPWYAQLTLADGRRTFRSTKTRNRRDARTIADGWQAAETEAARGELTRERVSQILDETLRRVGIAPESREERVSVGRWLNDWLESRRGVVSAGSFKGYAQAIREFLDWLGETGARRRLDAITEAEIERYVAALLRSGRSPSTVNTLCRRYLSIPFEKARKSGRIRYNPVTATSTLKEQKAPKATFSPEEIRALLKVADNDWTGAILFAYSTGARLHDVANLKWSALDTTNGVVVFTERKTDAQAVLGLHPDFSDWLRAQPVPFEREQPVFASLAGRAGPGLSTEFTALIDAAGIEKRLLRERGSGKGRSLRALSFHSFRHTAASAVFNGAALREITRRVTNHAASGVVDRYIHQDLEAIRAATALIPRLPK